jgi:hypothetical protein
MSPCLSRWSALALALACIAAAGCQDKERPKPITQAVAAALPR